MKYYISFDWGITNIGIAISQSITYVASPLKSIKSYNGIPKETKIIELIKEWNPDTIILGYPENINNKIFMKKFNKFYKYIKNFHSNIILHDEQYTTVESKNYLFNKSGFKALNKNNIDSFSAVIILNSWIRSIF